MPPRTYSALLIDGSSAVRTTLRNILQEINITQIDLAATVQEGRRKLQERKYDVVLCEYHFGGEETGQDLLEQMHERHAMPTPTIFIIVTAEASYPKVMSVAEVTPDEYVLKPVQSGNLSDRIEKAFIRRESLMELHESMCGQHYDRALKIAQLMLSSKSPYAADVAKMMAQALCKLARYPEAAAFYRHIVDTRRLAWAKFGLARVSLLQQDKVTAETLLIDVINQHLHYMPVYDYLVDFYIAELRKSDALGITERALEISPMSAKRLQLAGQLAFEVGDTIKTGEYLDRATQLRGSTGELDFRSMFHLTAVKLESGDRNTGASLIKQMRTRLKELESRPASGNIAVQRAQNYCELAAACEAIAIKPVAATDHLRNLSVHWHRPECDQAFVMDYFSVLNRIYDEHIAPTMMEWVRPLAFRFVTSSAVAALLSSQLAGCDSLINVVALEGGRVEDVIDQATRQESRGQLSEAATMLAEVAHNSRNTRLLLAAAEFSARAFALKGQKNFREGAEACLRELPAGTDDSTIKPIRAKLAAVSVQSAA